jgi:hypothetical protein
VSWIMVLDLELLSTETWPLVFFYGTLCFPAILERVLGRICEDLTFQDGLLPVSYLLIRFRSSPMLKYAELYTTLRHRGGLSGCHQP